jgi:hypothetical protein
VAQKKYPPDNSVVYGHIGSELTTIINIAVVSSKRRICATYIMVIKFNTTRLKFLWAFVLAWLKPRQFKTLPASAWGYSTLAHRFHQHSARRHAAKHHFASVKHAHTHTGARQHKTLHAGRTTGGKRHAPALP